MDTTEEKDPSIITNSPKIPGYTVLSRLGEGGMATVYLAIQESFGRKVALKVMMPKAQADKSYGERFTREAKIVARLSHPHIVPVFDVGVAGDYHYISMEYLNNGDLAARIKKGKMPVPEVLRIMRDVASALDYAHRKGIIHRDVKPDNIMFREDGAAVLTDFGIARPAAPDTNMTQIGKVIGTPKYMSPEQTKGEELDSTCDLYALGIMFHEMLTGQVPFNGKDPFEIGIKHLKAPLPKLPASFAVFQPLLDGLLAKSRTKRIQTGQEVIETLEAIGNSLGSRTPRKTAPTIGRARSEDRGTVIMDASDGMRADINDRSDTHLSSSPQKKSSPLLLLVLGVILALCGGFVLVWQAPAIAPESALMGIHKLFFTAPEPAPVVAAPKAPEKDPVEEKIRISLEKAKMAMGLGNYVTPVGDSALDHFRAATALDANNMEAQQGVVEIANQLVAQASEAVELDQLDRAKELVSQARSISENIPGLMAVEAAIADKERKLLARSTKPTPATPTAEEIAAERERLAAEEAKRQADAEAKRIADAEARRQADQAMEEERILKEEQERKNALKAQAEKASAFQVKLQVKGLLAKGDTYFSRKEYYAPARENALDKYVEALSLDPQNAQAKEGINKVIAIMIPDIHKLLENLQEAEAQALYRKALAAAPGHGGLASLGKNKGW